MNKLLTYQECAARGYRFLYNVYGDNINVLKCRSIWMNKGKAVKCSSPWYGYQENCKTYKYNRI